MAWLKSNWRWTVLNGIGVFVVAYVLSQGSQNWNDNYTFDPMLESGKWAIRFLLFCLAMTPLNTYLHWRQGIKLRKAAGLWAFGFAALHLYLLTSDKITGLMVWLQFPIQNFIVFGLFAIVTLSVLALTSNRWAMKRLGKRWKQLHRLVYLAGGAAVYHAMLASNTTKKMWIRDPQALNELKLYAVTLAVLLVVRIPLVRALINRLRQAVALTVTNLRYKPMYAPAIPDPLPEFSPPYLPDEDEKPQTLPAEEIDYPAAPQHEQDWANREKVIG